MTTRSQNLCTQCHGRLLAGDRFCAHCGAPQEVSHPGAGEEAAAAAWDAVLEELRAATAGKYEVGRMLGAGGMAAVFLAREIRLPRRVAIKVMAPSLMLAPGMVERFRREAATVAGLNHPNIVTIYTVEETTRLQYFVMKYVGGPSLDAVVQQHGPLPAPVAIAWLTQMASALGYAHRRGVIHRDVKPANILLDDEGAAIVTDFGIAKVVRERSLTQVGATVGTPAYMSPEQCLSREVTAASDQYSLGIVAYEMLTGEPPFSGPSLEVMQAHVQQRPPPIAVTRPDCPGELQAAIARMLAKDPEERFLNLEDVIAAIGGKPLGHDDPLRFQLADLAGGRTPSPVAPVSGPRSPVPAVRAPVSSPAPVAPPAAPARVASVEVSPPLRTLALGRRARLRAVVRAADGSELGDRPVRWGSSDPVVAAVSDDGVVRGLELGVVTVTAECESQRGAATVEVTEAGLLASLGRFWWAALAAAVVGVVLLVVITRPPKSLEVAAVTVLPSRSSVSVGGALTLSVAVQQADGSELAGAALRWTSSEPRVASVSSDGVVTALAPGQVTIMAMAADGTTGSATVTVTRTVPQVAAVTVEPAAHRAVPGDRFRLVARAVDPSGLVLGDRMITWSSSDSTVAAVSPAGEVTAGAPGTAVVTAASEGQRGSAEVTVAFARVARIALERQKVVAEVGARFQMQARIFDERGRPLLDRLVAWESTNPAVATVGSDGTIRAMAVGLAEIVGRSEDQSARATLEVVPSSGVTVRVMLARSTVSAGDSVLATATLVDPQAAPPSGGFTWTVSDTAVARVSARGVVYARAPGTVIIGARAGTKQGGATLLVAARALTLGLVSAGGQHTCGVAAAGDVLCWGLNDRGQVVAGGPAASPAALRHPGPAYVMVSSGGSHSCGITRLGAVDCWGQSSDGRLGAAPSGAFQSVAAGGKHSCAVQRGGAVLCWGSNDRGQLGDGSQQQSRTPRVVSGGLFDSVVAGGEHTCALAGGTAFCWGSNWAGAVGAGKLPGTVKQPVAVAGGIKFRTLSAGATHTCGISTAGAVYCWGGNAAGQVGDGSTEDRLRPVPVAPNLRFSVVSAGGAHTCAVTTAGQAYCWGRNDTGQLGSGGMVGSLRPVAAGGSVRFQTISAGGAHTCGVASGGEVQCWGANAQGQLGDGSQTNRPLPVTARVASAASRP